MPVRRIMRSEREPYAAIQKKYQKKEIVYPRGFNDKLTNLQATKDWDNLKKLREEIKVTNNETIDTIAFVLGSSYVINKEYFLDDIIDLLKETLTNYSVKPDTRSLKTMLNKIAKTTNTKLIERPEEIIKAEEKIKENNLLRKVGVSEKIPAEILNVLKFYFEKAREEEGLKDYFIGRLTNLIEAFSNKIEKKGNAAFNNKIGKDRNQLILLTTEKLHEQGFFKSAKEKKDYITFIAEKFKLNKEEIRLFLAKF